MNSSLIESLIFMLPDTIAYLDYFGTIVFAITGCLVAARRQSDILAFILLGLATAVGGGTLRDILIGRLPVFWIEDPIYIILCVVTAITMFIGLHRLTRIRHYHFLLNWADAVGLSTFTIIGTHVAITSGIPIIPSILLGVSTACFGGVIRDLLSGHSTLIMRNDVYMTASIIGAIVYIVFIGTGFESYAVPASFISSLTMRGLAIQYDLKLPGHKYFENDA